MPPISLKPEDIRAIAELLGETGVDEIEVVDGERSIRISKNVVNQSVPYVAATAPMAAPQLSVPASAPSAAPVAEMPASDSSHANALRSPMVGTVYLQPDPESPQFASVGDRVTEGDTLMIIEAMKVMNPIKAPHSGTVKAILVENQQPVEFDDPLIVIG